MCVSIYSFYSLLMFVCFVSFQIAEFPPQFPPRGKHFLCEIFSMILCVFCVLNGLISCACCLTFADLSCWL